MNIYHEVTWALIRSVCWSHEIAKLMVIKEDLQIAMSLHLKVDLVECDSINIIKDLNESFPLSVRSLLIATGGGNCCFVSHLQMV